MRRNEKKAGVWGGGFVDVFFCFLLVCHTYILVASIISADTVSASIPCPEM